MTEQQRAAMRRCEEAQRTNRTAYTYRMNSTSVAILKNEAK